MEGKADWVTYLQWFGVKVFMFGYAYLKYSNTALYTIGALPLTPSRLITYIFETSYIIPQLIGTQGMLDQVPGSQQVA